MSHEAADEKERQEAFPWERSQFHATYNRFLGQFKVESCLEHARGGRLLDLACGDGLMTAMMAPRFQRVVGVDASGQHLAAARKRVPLATFVESLIEDFETDEKFDTVLLLDILEHVRDPVAVLAHVSRFLAPRGVIVAHVPNAVAVNRRINVLMGSLEKCEELSPFDINVAGHRRSYTRATLVDDFKAAGLSVAATGGIFFKMLSTPQMDFLLSKGEWEAGGHGWGRTGAPARDWRAAFCRACYEFGKDHPDDCNIVFAVGARD